MLTLMTAGAIALASLSPVGAVDSSPSSCASEPTFHPGYAGAVSRCAGGGSAQHRVVLDCGPEHRVVRGPLVVAGASSTAYCGFMEELAGHRSETA
ncbi:hypothetical protein [Allokutzneria sp. NRRL B-24872]|uniref:hypothetical protein n=1 Tax=Allokutzneria sp. NRRL B-24872 TaxID=1137961 RepID=UPI000A39B3AC|nr:hypothetical protein [Allokutzneria sp. NRRL B-24872]